MATCQIRTTFFSKDTLPAPLRGGPLVWVPFTCGRFRKAPYEAYFMAVGALLLFC